MALSIAHELRGKSVLITGGVGYLGGVVVQQLLSLIDVKRVYLLVRGKRDQSAQERVQKVLCGALFNELHSQVAQGGDNVFAKIRVVPGDLELPGLGLSESDRQLLQSEVEVVIHSAASLTLDAHIQRALKANFVGTRQLLELAAGMQHARSFVYLSTYYVNNFLPYNTPVPEQVHRPTLQLAGDPRELSYAQLADLLLSMPPDTAAAEVAGIMSRLNFTSTYAFSKLLTEQLVDDAATLPGVGKAIVRPSLIASMAAGPYPGYISGFAGAPGYSLAYAMGFFRDLSSVAFASDAIIDLIPVDTTAALVIAAAAAAAAANGPYTGSSARVYHAASAASYPERAPAFFEKLHDFWTANPPPFKLPGARYPTFSAGARHNPTTKSMRAGLRVTSAKCWVITKLLQLTGHSREARRLAAGVQAFLVQNCPRYARSIVSCVDNARTLQASLVPQEQSVWRCVWAPDLGADWQTYTINSLVGLRANALKLPPSDVKGFTHSFVLKQGLADTSLMAAWMMAAGTGLVSSRGEPVVVSEVVHGVAAEGEVCEVSSSSDDACSSVCHTMEDVGELGIDSSSSSNGSSSRGSSDGGSSVDDSKLPAVDSGVAVKRSKSCGAVLVKTA